MTRYTSDKELRGRREGRERGWKEGRKEKARKGRDVGRRAGAGGPWQGTRELITPAPLPL